MTTKRRPTKIIVPDGTDTYRWTYLYRQPYGDQQELTMVDLVDSLERRCWVYHPYGTIYGTLRLGQKQTWGKKEQTFVISFRDSHGNKAEVKFTFSQIDYMGFTADHSYTSISLEYR